MTKNKNSTVYYYNNKQINNTLKKKMSQAPGKDLIRDGNW